MKIVPILNKILIILVGHIAGYKVVNGMEPYTELTTFYYTVGFGTIVLVALLLLMFKLQVLMNNWVMILTAFIPVGLSLGLINQFVPSFNYLYMVISIIGVTAVIITRLKCNLKTATMTTSLVHGVSGLIVLLLPVYLVLNNDLDYTLLFVSIGAILLGLEGILQTFNKLWKPVVSTEQLNEFFPLLLTLSTTAFVAGLHYIK